MNPELATTQVELVSDSTGAVDVEHGFSPKPDSIITNSLDDEFAVPPENPEVDEKPIAPGQLKTYAFAVTYFDDTRIKGHILDRETGEIAPEGTTLKVELAGVYFG